MGNHDFDFQTDKAIAVDGHQDFMTLYWQDGGVSRFHYQWLRDNCRSAERFDPSPKNARR